MVMHVDPKTKKPIGIYCDVCNKVFINKFEYFSAKFDHVVVDKEACVAGPKEVDRRYLDLDFCQKCMNELIEKVKIGIKAREKNANKMRVDTKR
jgi:hypothetical protein